MSSIASLEELETMIRMVRDIRMIEQHLPVFKNAPNLTELDKIRIAIVENKRKQLIIQLKELAKNFIHLPLYITEIVKQ